ITHRDRLWCADSLRNDELQSVTVGQCLSGTTPDPQPCCDLLRMSEAQVGKCFVRAVDDTADQSDEGVDKAACCLLLEEVLVVFKHAAQFAVVFAAHI